MLSKTEEKGLTLIPLEIYFRKGEREGASWGGEGTAFVRQARKTEEADSGQGGQTSHEQASMISVSASSFVSGFGIVASLALAVGGPTPGAAQTGDSLLVHGPDDSVLSLSVRRSRGYATVPHEALRQLGWAVEVDVPRLRARLGSEGPVVEFSLDSPLFRWDQELLQLVSAPFSRDGSVQIPLQFRGRLPSGRGRAKLMRSRLATGRSRSSTHPCGCNQVPMADQWRPWAEESRPTNPRGATPSRDDLFRS